MSTEFLSFVNKLMEANPELTQSLMTDNVKNYLTLLETEDKKSPLTENGTIILRYLQKNIPEGPFKAADVAKGIDSTSRSVSSSLRKLIADGFCSRMGKDPIIYELTEKGRIFNIDAE